MPRYPISWPPQPNPSAGRSRLDRFFSALDQQSIFRFQSLRTADCPRGTFIHPWLGDGGRGLSWDFSTVITSPSGIDTSTCVGDTGSMTRAAIVPTIMRL